MRSDHLQIIGCCLLVPQLAWLNKAAGEELRHRGLIGVTLRAEYAAYGERGISAAGLGIHVVAVMPNSAAAEAKLQADDIIIKIGPDPTPNLDVGLKWLRKYFAGDKIELTILRKGKEKTVAVTLRARPKEKWDGFEVIYDQAGTNDQRVRTLITRPPAPGKYPAILFIQSLSPRSIELAFPMPYPLRGLVDGLTKEGFVFMRADRLGTGDSDGLSVRDTTVKMDIATFRGALAMLRTYEFVDPSKIFILAFSSGGAIAPIVARTHGVEGVITFGTMARPWIAQAVEMMRRRWTFELLPEDEIAANAGALRHFLRQCFVKRESLSEVFAENPDLADFVRKSNVVSDDMDVFGMSLSFGRQLMDLRIENEWAKVDAPVLAIWGQSDYIASRKDSELVVAAVNRAHAGSGTFVALPGTCHFCCEAEDQEESFLAGMGDFNPALVKTVADWIRQQIKNDDS